MSTGLLTYTGKPLRHSANHHTTIPPSMTQGKHTLNLYEGVNLVWGVGVTGEMGQLRFPAWVGGGSAHALGRPAVGMGRRDAVGATGTEAMA
jgi:hypothetical protein